MLTYTQVQVAGTGDTELRAGTARDERSTGPGNLSISAQEDSTQVVEGEDGGQGQGAEDGQGDVPTLQKEDAGEQAEATHREEVEGAKDSDRQETEVKQGQE